MAQTDRHEFFLWAAGFTQSDVILNDLLLKLERRVALSVKSRTTTAQPGSPTAGDCYIIPSGATGAAWSGFDEHDVAIFRDSTWYAEAPITGLPAWVEDDANGVIFNGTSWTVVSKDLPQDKLDATAAPTVNDDIDLGYSVGSHWYDVTNDKAYVCLDATDGAAVWTEITQSGGGGGVQNKFDGTTAPTVDNDTTEGYEPGSQWVDVTNDKAYVCLDATDGAAVWTETTQSGSAPDTGTFTPTLQDGSFSDAESQAYTEQSGVYRKIGDVCFFWIDIAMSSLGSLTGGDVAYIANLPFTAASLGTLSPVQVGWGQQLSITAGTSVSGVVLDGTTRIHLTKWSATTGTANLTVAEITANGRLRVSGSYVTA